MVILLFVYLFIYMFCSRIYMTSPHLIPPWDQILTWKPWNFNKFSWKKTTRFVHTFFFIKRDRNHTKHFRTVIHDGSLHMNIWCHHSSAINPAVTTALSLQLLQCFLQINFYGDKNEPSKLLRSIIQLYRILCAFYIWLTVKYHIRKLSYLWIGLNNWYIYWLESNRVQINRTHNVVSISIIWVITDRDVLDLVVIYLILSLGFY